MSEHGPSPESHPKSASSSGETGFQKVTEGFSDKAFEIFGGFFSDTFWGKRGGGGKKSGGGGGHH